MNRSSNSKLWIGEQMGVLVTKPLLEGGGGVGAVNKGEGMY